MALPCELLDEILCRLPVKHLLRCRCVSKQWCSLIDSTYFVEKHYKASLDRNSGGIVIGSCGEFFLADCESLEGDVVNGYEINDPFLSGADLVGSANGLLCFSKFCMDVFLLLNPSTRNCKRLPDLPDEFSSFSNNVILYGFGYDNINDDYKVVKMSRFDLPFRCTRTIVYSLKTNLWTQIGDVLPDVKIVFIGKRGAFGSGALHWHTIDVENRKTFVLSFDLGLEKFAEVAILLGNTTSFVRGTLVSFGGCLCILDHYNRRPVNVWQVFNYKGKITWSMAFSVDLPEHMPFKFQPLAYSKSRQDILLRVKVGSGRRLMWYHHGTRTVKNVSIPWNSGNSRIRAHMYAESLFHFTKDKPSHEAKEKKQQSKKRFLTMLMVVGSIVGSLMCFNKAKKSPG